MNLLQEFQQEYGTAMVFISHDFGVVNQLCSSVAVMYLGKICETGPTEALFKPPYHPYTGLYWPLYRSRTQRWKETASACWAQFRARSIRPQAAGSTHAARARSAQSASRKLPRGAR